jgi:hypothetical protein
LKKEIKREFKIINMKKDLKYYRINAEEDYLTTPISVLRYIGLMEKRNYLLKAIVYLLLSLICFGGVIILNN